VRDISEKKLFFLTKTVLLQSLKTAEKEEWVRNRLRNCVM